MNEFIKKMLELGAELDQSTTGIEANLVINDAEILYKNHIKQLRLHSVSKSVVCCPQCGNERLEETSVGWYICCDKDCDWGDKL
jgi:hypothetical protein